MPKKNPSPSSQKRLEKLHAVYEALREKRRDVARKYGANSLEWVRADRKAVRANTLLLEAAAKVGYEKFLKTKKVSHRKNPAPSEKSRYDKLKNIFESLHEKAKAAYRKFGHTSPEFKSAREKSHRAHLLFVKEYLGKKTARKRRENPFPASTLPKSPHDPIYSERVKLRGYNGPVSVLTAHGFDAAKVLRKLLPTMTVWQHLTLKKKYHVRGQKWQRAYNDLLNKAAMETWGRKWRVTDYKISGIGSDEFSPAMKARLRKALKEETAYMTAFAAHSHVAATMRERK